MVLKAATQATGDLHAALTAILIVPRPHDIGSYITDDRITCLQATTTSSVLNGHLNFWFPLHARFRSRNDVVSSLGTGTVD